MERVYLKVNLLIRHLTNQATHFCEVQSILSGDLVGMYIPEGMQSE